MYGNAEKSNWRETVWDAANADRREWVLALAGKRFLDRKAAIRRGFDPNKIVGVDLDDEVVKHNTEHSRVVVQRELSEVMHAWDDSRPVGVVVADFTCNGGAQPVQEMLWAWAHLKAFKNCWLVLNVSVGREVGKFLEFIRDVEYYDRPTSRFISMGGANLIKQHRAYQALEYFFMHDLDDNDWSNTHNFYETAIKVQYRYQAHKMHMDTIVVAPDWSVISPKWNRVDRISGVELLEDKSIRRHIGAKLAWNTMRNNA